MRLEFEDNLNDAVTATAVTAKNPDGTEAAPEFVAGVDGKGKALNLSNNSVYLDLGTRGDINPADLTVSFWVKPNGVITGENIFVWTKYQYNQNGWYIGSEDGNRPIVFSVGVGSPQPLEFRVTGAARNQFFPADTWTHIAVTYDSTTKQAVIYRNGVPQEIAVTNPDAAGTIENDPATSAVVGRNGGHNDVLANYALDGLIIINAAVTAQEAVGLRNEKKAE
jgi:hypothetical protein